MLQDTENIEKRGSYFKNRFAVAPMIDWTDRHCRFFHRQLSHRALLYTEMVVADAIIHGPRDRLLGFSDAEHPVALQLGGSDPIKLAEAASISAPFGYDEINLNVGCPSERVQSGTFGACLMQTPDVVAACVAAMKSAVDVPVTVKCRIGVDDQDEEAALDALADAVFAQGCDALWVHARKAWLQGLSPKENRDIPPLNYERVYRLKRRYPDKFIGINGGIASIADGLMHREHVDGVMLGRLAYQNPEVLMQVDAAFYDDKAYAANIEIVLESMRAYIEDHIAGGGKLSHITRHIVGLFHGLPGARRFRQILSEDAQRPRAGVDILDRAVDAVRYVQIAAQ